MSRPLRIDYPNAWHHVMNQARRGQALFVDKADHQQFINLLQETAELFNVNVAAYCLLTNHYHLMLQTPDANLSRCMRHLNGVYMRVKAKLRADRKFKDCLEHIENNILKSQT